MAPTSQDQLNFERLPSTGKKTLKDQLNLARKEAVLSVHSFLDGPCFFHNNGGCSTAAQYRPKQCFLNRE